MNNSASENDRVNNSPNNLQNNNGKDNSREINQRLLENKCPFRIFGWDSNDDPIPEEQAQLVDPPKSLSVHLTQQQSQVSPPNMQKTEEEEHNLPWTVVIPPEETEEQTQLVDPPKSSSVNSIQQQSQQPLPLPINYNGSLNNNNQAVLPISNPNQVGFVSSSYYSNQYSYLIPVDASTINRQDALNNLEIEKQWEIARIEISKRRALHDEDLRYEQEKKRLNQHTDSIETPKHINGSTSIATNETPFIDWKKLVDEFIKKCAIVTVKRRNKKGKVIMILNEDENRHVEISLKDLTDYYVSFIEDTHPDTVEFTLKKINLAMLHLKNHIPKLEKSSLRCLEPHQVMFMNGFLDVKEFTFYSIPESERNQYYTTFSFDIDCKEYYQEPEIFSNLLFDALNGDQEAFTLAYEQIGAIFTPIPTLKKIFLFQGVSNAGKTRIGNIIAKCMPVDDTLVLNNLSELTKDKLDSSPLRLILIRELSKNKLYAKQIAILKALSDGSADTAFTKILMSTNYPIYTDENGSIEPALRNRLSIDVSCFEDVHFENEKLGIIIWALEAFSQVLNNNNRFYKEFEPNSCVNAENKQEISPEEESQPYENDSTKPITTDEILELLFKIVDEVNEEMTAECIMDAVNNFSPKDQTRISRKKEVGKVLGKFFGEKLKHRRIKGVMCYNLNWKDKIGDI